MTSLKPRLPSEICADCSATDPSWTSINRGVYICDECCCIHRSLGRHISHVKSLKRGAWSPSLYTMVQSLAQSKANSIWEHSLLDPATSKGRKKPTAKDSLHPTKADFIRAKYQYLSYVQRVGKDSDGTLTPSADISKQLHSSVRTSNLETSLRLLAMGADPNFFHPEKGNFPIHVAAAEGQLSQVELLVVYGADPGIMDINGKTPGDCVRLLGYEDIANRLVECEYEITDRLAFYLCGRKPDHPCGQHFIIPEMADSSTDLSELAKVAKQKLQSLSNNLFEELVRDVYDEVDRRETDAIWLSTQKQSTLVTDRQSIPFLPVNPEFSATRNQGRQKLARFNAREFATLIIDILSDAKRRQLGMCVSALHSPRDILLPAGPSTAERKRNLSSLSLPAVTKQQSINMPTASTPLRNSMSNISDDEPLYDSVASDEESLDYHRLSDLIKSRVQDLDDLLSPGQEQAAGTESSRSTVTLLSADVAGSDKSSGGEATSPSMVTPPAGQDTAGSDKKISSGGGISMEEYIQVKKALASSDVRVQKLLTNHRDMKQEIMLLQHMVQKLMQENASLQKQMQRVEKCTKSLDCVEFDQPRAVDTSSLDGGLRRTSPVRGFPSATTTAAFGHRPQSMYEPRDPNKPPYGFTPKASARVLSGFEPTQIAEEDAWPTPERLTKEPERTREGTPCSTYDNEEVNTTSRLDDARLPTGAELNSKTETLTRRIQELLAYAQGGKHDQFLASSEKILDAVSDMASIFPQSTSSVEVSAALARLASSGSQLQMECCKFIENVKQRPTDLQSRTKLVIQRAYDIAKAAKTLVTIFQ